jgi:predicted component of type VI protein secretion system
MPGEKLLIGQAKACQLRPTGDDIEQEHCMIFTQEGQLLIRDLKSRTGTFVNGAKIAGEQELKTGDRVRVGRLEFDIRITVDVGGKKKSKIRSIKEAAARLVQQSAGADDLDISQWLTETDHTPTMMDTKQLQSHTGPENPEPQIPEKLGKKPATLFDQDEGAKLATGSSKEAAAEILKQMFATKQTFGRKPRT